MHVVRVHGEEEVSSESCHPAPLGDPLRAGGARPTPNERPLLGPRCSFAKRAVTWFVGPCVS